MSQSVFCPFPSYRHNTVIYHETMEFKFIALQHLLFIYPQNSYLSIQRIILAQFSLLQW